MRRERSDLPGDPPQRGQVQVVVVQMRDQQGIEALGQLGRRRLAVPAEVGHARAQHRIREQARTRQLQQHGRVPTPDDAVTAHAAFLTLAVLLEPTQRPRARCASLPADDGVQRGDRRLSSLPPGDSADRRTRLAAERTWLAWWRSGIAAATASVAVGGVVPELVDDARIGYVVLGAGYALLATAVFVGAGLRERRLARSVEEGGYEGVST